MSPADPTHAEVDEDVVDEGGVGEASIGEASTANQVRRCRLWSRLLRSRLLRRRLIFAFLKAYAADYQKGLLTDISTHFYSKSFESLRFW